MTSLHTLKPYPLRIQPKSGESLKSVMHRLAQRNGFAFFNWLVADVAIKNMGGRLGPDHVARLSTISGLGVNDLNRRQGTQKGPLHSLLGHKLTMSMVEKTVSRLCLDCLRDDPYHRMAWDFAPLVVCPVHATRLIDACPKCKLPLHWRRNKLTECGDGHDLLECSSRNAVHRIPSEDLGGMLAIAANLLDNRNNRALLDSLSLSDGELPLIDLVCMFDVLGSMNMERVPGPRISTRTWFSQSDYHLIANRAYEIATDWPRAFHAALEELGPRNDPPLFLIDTKDPRRRRLHTALRHYSDRPFAKVIARGIGEYAIQNRISMMPGAFGLQSNASRASLISATKASRMMKTMKVEEIARRERWIGYRQIGNKRNVMLRRADVEQWIENNKVKPLTTRDIRRMLRVTPKTIVALRDRGLFGEEARTRRTKLRRDGNGAEGGGWHAFPSEIERLTELLNDLPRKLPPASPGEYASWSGFKRVYPEPPEFEFADAISKVAAGQVQAVLANPTKLSTIKFKVSDLSKFANMGKVQPQAAKVKTELTPHMAVKRYRMTWYCLQRMVDLGLLQVRRTPYKVPTCWISTDAMDDVLARFTTPGILAGKHRKSPSSVARALDKLNVQPYLAGQGRYPEAKFYAWREIESAGLKAVLKLAADLPPKQRRSDDR